MPIYLYSVLIHTCRSVYSSGSVPEPATGFEKATIEKRSNAKKSDKKTSALFAKIFMFVYNVVRRKAATSLQQERH